MVAGRNRVPSPATGNTAFVIFCIFVYAPRSLRNCFSSSTATSSSLRLVELRSGFFARDDIVGLLRDRSGDLPAGRLDALFRFIARHRPQRSGQHHDFTCEGSRGRLHPALALLQAHLPLQAFDDFLVVLLPHEGGDGLGHDGPHVGDFDQFLDGRAPDGVELSEVPGDVFRGDFPDIADSQRVDEPRERRLAALLDRGDHVRRRLLGHAVELRQLGEPERVEVRGRVHDAAIDELVDELVAQALDVHGAARGEMQQRLLALRGTEEPAGAARDRLVLAT